LRGRGGFGLAKRPLRPTADRQLVPRPSRNGAVRELPDEWPVEGDHDSAESETQDDPGPRIGLLWLSGNSVHGADRMWRQALEQFRTEHGGATGASEFQPRSVGLSTGGHRERGPAWGREPRLTGGRDAEGHALPEERFHEDIWRGKLVSLGKVPARLFAKSAPVRWPRRFLSVSFSPLGSTRTAKPRKSRSRRSLLPGRSPHRRRSPQPQNRRAQKRQRI
jgi:hypothetical protein